MVSLPPALSGCVSGPRPRRVATRHAKSATSRLPTLRCCGRGVRFSSWAFDAEARQSQASSANSAPPVPSAHRQPPYRCKQRVHQEASCRQVTAAQCARTTKRRASGTHTPPFARARKSTRCSSMAAARHGRLLPRDAHLHVVFDVRARIKLVNYHFGVVVVPANGVLHLLKSLRTGRTWSNLGRHSNNIGQIRASSCEILEITGRRSMPPPFG